jgi:hypothetical protein
LRAFRYNRVISTNSEQANGQDAARSGAQRAPDWALGPFEALVDYAENLWNVLHLSLDGISMLRSRPRAIEVLAEVKAEDSETASRLASAKRIAELAQREVDTNFPVVHAQFVVALWGSMESFLSRFAAQWILNRPETLREDPWCTLKIRLGDYEQGDSEQKTQYLVEVLEQSLGSHLKQGVNRFEAVISALGVAGNPGEESVKEAIFELQQIRNVIVHKQGTADRRLCTTCPWLNLAIGQQVQVTHDMCAKYHDAAMAYVVELIFRTSEFFGDLGHRERTRKIIEK